LSPEQPRGITPFQDIRTLPVTVRPVDGETSTSYLHRLAAANSLSTETVWGHLRALHQSLPDKRNAYYATTELEALGGLPEHWFTSNRNRHRLPIRCPHHNWQLRICDTCSTTPTERPGCIRCSAGDPTHVATATGTICLRHRRWTHNGTDLDISHLPRHLTAEKHFRRDLTNRGIALGTGEIELAHSLLAGWQHPHPPTALHPAPGTASTLFDLYPEVVKLTITLTDPAFTAVLMHPRWSPSQHALVLSRAITDILGHPLSDPSLSTLWETIHNDKKAIEAAYAMMGTRSKRKCCSQRAFCAAAYTHRACLLRHLNAKNMPHRIPAIPSRPAITVRATVRYQQAPTT
jgi:hypothetical protein